MATTTRQTHLATALKHIQLLFGKGALMRMGDKVETRVSAVSSGSLAIQHALGVGGLPRGHFVTIYGPTSSD